MKKLILLALLCAALHAQSYYALVNKSTGHYLTGAGTTNGSLIQDLPLIGDDTQRWTLNQVAAGVAAITLKSTGKVVDDTGYSMSSGTTVQQWDYLSGTNQQWREVPIGGYYKFTNVMSGMTLQERSDGYVVQRTDTGADAELWLVVSSNPPVASVNFSDAEVPSGAVDGTNQTFTFAHTILGFPIIVVNGVVMSTQDFTVSGPSVTFGVNGTTINAGDQVVGWYRY